MDLIGLAQDRLLLDVPVNSGGQSDKVAAQVRFDFEGLGLVAKARLESELFAVGLDQSVPGVGQFVEA